LIQTKPN